MSIRVSLLHRTLYEYDRPVTLSPQIIRLRPAAHCRTPVSAYTLKIGPEEHFLNWQQDPFGNHLARVVFPGPQKRFEVEVGLIADLTVINPFDFFVEPEADNYPFTYAKELSESLAPYLEVKEKGPLLQEWLKGIDRKERNLVSFLVELNRRVQKDIQYSIRMEPGVQSCDETLQLASGSCRDSTWLLVQILRHIGIAARFASGYLIQLKPDQKPLTGPPGPESDFTDLHAWAEAYVPGAGWVGLDPTSGLMAGEGHIPLCCTPSPQEAAPISGAVSKCETKFHFHMEVDRYQEVPRVTLPYSQEQWQNLLALGDRVDARMQVAGMQLTQGGEPTFVSVDDMDGAEWNTEAMGPNKYGMAQDLMGRLQARFAPGSLLHYGQGKWYPGEPLPRWALNCYWRADGRPVWQNERLHSRQPIPGGVGPKEAGSLVRAITRQLLLEERWVKSAHEDVFYYLWQEGRLPIDFDPLTHDYKKDSERVRLLKLLERGLESITGFVLPLGCEYDGIRSQWRSGLWDTKRGHLFLVPGDSPMGFRLPLASLPYGSAKPEFAEEMSPLEARPPLSENLRSPLAQLRGSNGSGRKGHGDPADPLRQPPPEKAAEKGRYWQGGTYDPVLRTALCVEPRDGHLYVFMPPVTHLESYLELVSAIELAAQEQSLPVRIEGYKPPHDYRLKSFSVTPDPGVIEVNIHPSPSWREWVMNQEILYEEARQCRLGTEKYQLDGRHTGTGGGNHVVLGAARPSDSPFLRRPDLLRSVVNFWQNHPSMSYLFSGLFIGPTSQSPRVDEARDSALGELEIAFQQVPDGVALFPWQVDRIFRNLLVDLTGNTHRTEISIDKLYSPDSMSGRLGLVEFRGFEMPPHAQMSAAQGLLIRALVNQFWEKPYRAPLQPWGTSLHDKWMLPHFLWRDLEDVLGYLKSGGMTLDPAWYQPFLDFRFPKAGEVNLGDVQLEIRHAAEPWPVLGEEATGQGTSRYVDSSLERVQVLAKGIGSRRHSITCNGVTLPMTPTGTQGEAVAGLRYRAWQPPSCLQPLIGIHSPLTFDLIDGWNNRSLGGCTYHVVHPAGRNYATFPVNAAEAEARRAHRFDKKGYTPGVVSPQSPRIHPDHPVTLDMRLQ
jgi:uncharacterized protein (DUF2126 family)/transglutaminase-like putative cysteine protease